MTEADQIEALKHELKDLAYRAAILNDIHQIRELQHKYGYYLDKCLFEEVVNLFSENGEMRAMGNVFKGKAGLRRVFVGFIGGLYTGGRNGPVDGLLSDHMQLQDIVDVEPDRMTAKARFRYFMPGGVHESRALIPGMPQQWWEAGLYENEYVREDGIWKFLKLCLHTSYRADYQTGWRYATPMRFSGVPKLFPEDPLGPDEVVEDSTPAWPEAGVMPFHYSHPVTGKPWRAK
jgi:hypothetical protein